VREREREGGREREHERKMEKEATPKTGLTAIVYVYVMGM